MTSNAKMIAAFIFGAAVGAAIAFKYAAKKLDAEQHEYEDIIDVDPVDEVEDEPVGGYNITTTETSRAAAEQAKQKKDITEYASKITKEAYISESTEEPENVETVEAPYVISPDEFGEYAYETISLTYYADDVLADENYEIVDDIADVVGNDFASHFGEYEDDSVFVRNDRKRCDYEILRDYRNYSDL